MRHGATAWTAGAVIAGVAIGGWLTRSAAQVQAPPEWRDPGIVGVNKEPAHATLTVFADEAGARVGLRSGSPYYQSLNGEWKFHWDNRRH
jgi:beta-galactosidase